MKIEIEINIMCSEDAETDIYESGDLECDLAMWDISQDKSGINKYFETEYATFENNLPYSNYVLKWGLNGPNISEDELRAVMKGVIITLDNLENPCNYQYHDVERSLFKPQHAFHVQKVIVDNKEYDLSLFEDFNKRNEKLYRKF